VKDRIEQLGDPEKLVGESAAVPVLSPNLGTPQNVLALQRTAGNSAVGAMLEQDAAGQRPQAVSPRSPALLLRSQLRTPHLQRAVTTAGGDWDTDYYNTAKDNDGQGNAYPAAANVRGADIKLKFKPNATVDAEEIGLVQSVQSYVAGAPNLTVGAQARNIKSADAKPINTGAGETDEGTAIDQSATSNNPVYAVESDKSTKLTDPVDNYFGENGWRYTDKSGVKEKTAWMFDKPRRGGANKDSRQIFEVTALAIKGAQVGTYYGSVRWGWRTDAAGAHTKIDLAKVAEGIPSSTFLKAGEIWNASKTPGGKDTVDLPMPDKVKKTTGPVTLKPPIPMADIALPVGTRVQIVSAVVGPLAGGTIKVVDGPHNGITGEVAAGPEWGNIADER
jgi:hypothetical protein